MMAVPFENGRCGGEGEKGMLNLVFPNSFELQQHLLTTRRSNVSDEFSVLRIRDPVLFINLWIWGKNPDHRDLSLRALKYSARETIPL
jgi:hypothetical protein